MKTDTLYTVLGAVLAAVILIVVESLCICYLWLWLIVPMGAPLLMLREAFAVGMFINFFIMQHKISNDQNLTRNKRVAYNVIATVGYLVLSYIYSAVLL